MDVIAKLRFLRMSPRKVRLVVNAVRGQHVLLAQQRLGFMANAAARPVLKLLNSAVANAEHNFKLEQANLLIKQAFVDQGPALKRWHPRAFGRAAEILKRSSHITIVLGEISATGTKKKKGTKGTATLKKPSAASTKKAQPVVDFRTIKHAAKGPQANTETAGPAGGTDQKPVAGFKKVKEQFTRRLGEG